MVDRINVETLLKHYKPGGTSVYPPRMLLKVLIYGYLSNTFPSEKLEAALRKNIYFIWLAGMNKPDHNTIARFRSVRLKKRHSLPGYSGWWLALQPTLSRFENSLDKATIFNLCYAWIDRYIGSLKGRDLIIYVIFSQSHSIIKSPCSPKNRSDFQKEMKEFTGLNKKVEDHKNCFHSQQLSDLVKAQSNKPTF